MVSSSLWQDDVQRETLLGELDCMVARYLTGRPFDGDPACESIAGITKASVNQIVMVDDCFSHHQTCSSHSAGPAFVRLCVVTMGRHARIENLRFGVAIF